jgi:hyperosmotically inducible protein
MLVFLGGCTMGDMAGSEANKGAAEDTPSDSEITSAVETNLQKDELLASAQIDVTVDQGVVKLSGNVPSAQAFNRAISIARRVAGVKYVVAPSLLYTR